MIVGIKMPSFHAPLFNSFLYDENAVKKNKNSCKNVQMNKKMEANSVFSWLSLEVQHAFINYDDLKLSSVRFKELKNVLAPF